MNYHALYKTDMVNGEGVRVTLFVGGCVHACKGCYNQSTWNPDNGQPFTEEVEDEILRALEPRHIAGLSLTGGDPLFHRNLLPILQLIHKVREKFGKSKNIWLWSGYTKREIDSGVINTDDPDWANRARILDDVDVFIDGKFEQDKHVYSLPFRGSTNQIIHRFTL